MKLYWQILKKQEQSTIPSEISTRMEFSKKFMIDKKNLNKSNLRRSHAVKQLSNQPKIPILQKMEVIVNQITLSKWSQNSLATKIWKLIWKSTRMFLMIILLKNLDPQIVNLLRNLTVVILNLQLEKSQPSSKMKTFLILIVLKVLILNW